jgi:pimeloyl-ACP methyl ester carboxylesterase
MTSATLTAKTEGRSIRVNGTDINYYEAGSGEPVILLHGGVVCSANPAWGENPFAYASHVAKFAEHFRVITPDTRGAGRTPSPGGPASFSQFADDVAALIRALGLERPMVCGFSEGGMTATILSIREPGLVRAVVNFAGYDVFNPESRMFMMARGMLGGRPDATQSDPAAIEMFFNQSDEMRATFAMMKADLDGAQGPGYWKTFLQNLFPRMTKSPGYTFEDLRKVTDPTLILVGDRDDHCSVEEGAIAYRMLQSGEFAVLPNQGHSIFPAAVQATIEYFLRQARA